MINQHFFAILFTTLLLTSSMMLALPDAFAQGASGASCSDNNPCPEYYICQKSQGSTTGTCVCPFGEFEAPINEKVSGDICAYLANNQSTPFLSTVKVIVNFLTAIVVAIGLIMVVAAGYVYMTAGGDASKVGKAKTMIQAALFGIALALTAFLVLNTISPQFASEVKEPEFNTP